MNWDHTPEEKGEVFLRRLRWEWEHRGVADRESIKISRRLLRHLRLGDQSLMYHLTASIDARAPRSGLDYLADQLSLKLFIEALDQAEVDCALNAVRSSLEFRFYRELEQLLREAKARLP